MPIKKQKKTKGKINWKVFIIIFAIVFLVALIGSIFINSAVKSRWYNIVMPSIAPQRYIFPIVWNILFFLIFISLYINWTKANKKQKDNIILVYTANFSFNILWTFFYFWLINSLIAFFDMMALLVSIIAMIDVSYRIDKKAAYLLIPYLLWAGFATILNLITMI